jgi:hypothetical protein
VAGKPYYPRRVIALFSMIVVGTISCPARAAVWQWSALVKDSRENAGQARAFLWIPPECERVRGIVFAQDNMEEISILENPKFRAALSEINFAEVWVAPPFDHLFRFDAKAGDTFNAVMSDLTDKSGYNELSFAPIVGLGHSAAASWPYYFAAWNPGRTLAALSVSGQWPYFRHPQWAPDIWGDRKIDYIPCLESMGEYEAAATWSREGLKERQDHPLLPLSMLACPAEGHFASTDTKAEFLAFYIRKAIRYRVPKDWKGDVAPTLKPIDPTKTGWLSEKWLPDQKPAVAPAPVSKYAGDPREAFWFFDEETVRAVEKYQDRHRGKNPQLVGYLQDGKMVDQKDNHLQVALKFEPQEDGITFNLSGAFYDAVPGGSPRLPQWTGQAVGTPIGHATNAGPVSVDRIYGPFEKLRADTFILQLQKETRWSEERYSLVFAATHPGNSDYRPAVQQAEMFVPARNKEGADQHITFSEIPDLSRDAKSLKLKASSDANVPVHFYVREGPVEIDGETLRLTRIPPRAKFPVKVTVVAWQYGRGVDPKLKSAEPVERTFSIRQ